MQRNWYAARWEEAVEHLSSDPKMGLGTQEARARLGRFGLNQIEDGKQKTLVEMFFDQFKDFLVLILVGSTVIAAAMGEWLDAGVIVAILVLNAIMGVVQEGRAGKALAALKKMAVPVTTVIRDGRVHRIPSTELVPGDIVQLQAGDLVPADVRLIETINMKIDESALTGESVAVEKSAEAVLDESASVGDRVNSAYLGTVVTYGRGAGIVTSTGMNTEIGKIAKMVAAIGEEDTPLQKKLAEFGKWLGMAALAVCGLVFVVGLLEGEQPFNMFMTAISLAVAAIPEGLPAVVTIVLALGVQRMASRNAIIRRLPAVETLGCVTYICSDKTGTLTENKMTVREIYLAGGRHVSVTGSGYAPAGDFLEGQDRIDPAKDAELARIIGIAGGCNDASLVREGQAGQETWSIVGDPTEGALASLAAKAGFGKDEIGSAFPRVSEIPFDSGRKRMTTMHRCAADGPLGREGELIAFVKGAPDLLLSLSRSYLDGNEERPLTSEKTAEMLRLVGEMGGRGLRVLGFAMRKLDSVPGEPKAEEVETGLTFVGLIGMIDPVRPEVKEAIKVARRAGVTPVMVTGDYRETARAIALELGIMEPDGRVVTGAELERMDKETLEGIVRDVRVYARVSPEHKLRIVEAFKAHGEIVAMTGDGVNDAPALSAADIGVAMGMSGTDVAKGASDMVLADDNFATIVAAVEEGRAIFENIRKSVIYLLSCNIGELLLFLVSILAKLGNPLVPVQILLINLATDGLPALALGTDPKEGGIMDVPPRDTEEGILSKPLLVKMFVVGAAIAAAVLIPFVAFQRAGAPVEVARTGAFAVLGLSELLRALSSRSERHSILRAVPTQNPRLVGAVAVSAAIVVAAVQVPWIGRIFETVPLRWREWQVVVGASFIPMLVAELMKLLGRNAGLETRRTSRLVSQ